MAYRLPPLSTLRLFEAAGRHLSFKLAAEELCLTPSAVSHGIQSLEAWLGTPLFVRGHRSLALTEAGAAYLPGVQGAIETLAKATEAVPGRRPGGRLAVSVAPSFGLRWLIPRLPRFSAKHPDIEVTVDTAQRQVAFPRDGVDLAIRMGRGDWPELEACCLVREALQPVCAPALAERIRSPADLARVAQLRVVTVADDWESWFALAGLPAVTAERTLGFDNLHMALEAAIQGLGVVMGRLPLMAADLAAGRLRAVLGPPRPCPTGYWLVSGRGSPPRPEATAFRTWIQREL